MWDLKNYNHLYSIHDNNIHEIKISPGIMLLIYHKSSNGGHVPLKILSIDTGTVSAPPGLAPRVRGCCAGNGG